MKIHNYETSLDELKDCPFCGGRPVAFLRGNAYLNKMGKGVSITIKCPKCRIQRTDAVIRHSLEWLEETAIKNWNTQIVPDERQKVLAEVEKQIIDDLDTGEGEVFNKSFRAELRAKLAEMKK